MSDRRTRRRRWAERAVGITLLAAALGSSACGDDDVEPVDGRDGVEQEQQQEQEGDDGGYGGGY